MKRFYVPKDFYQECVYESVIDLGISNYEYISTALANEFMEEVLHSRFQNDHRTKKELTYFRYEKGYKNKYRKNSKDFDVYQLSPLVYRCYDNLAFEVNCGLHNLLLSYIYNYTDKVKDMIDSLSKGIDVDTMKNKYGEKFGEVKNGSFYREYPDTELYLRLDDKFYKMVQHIFENTSHLYYKNSRYNIPRYIFRMLCVLTKLKKVVCFKLYDKFFRYHKASPEVV
jgi:hypothetical protein